MVIEIKLIISHTAAPMPENEFGERYFNYNAAMHLNNLPQEAKIAESVISIKSILRQRMS